MHLDESHEQHRTVQAVRHTSPTTNFITIYKICRPYKGNVKAESKAALQKLPGSSP